MTFSQMQAEFFDGSEAFPEMQQADADSAGEAVRVSSYLAVLQEPTVSLVGGAIDRPDVATVAILGYN
jgi:hypothetical protein